MTLPACRFLEGADANIIFTSAAYEPSAVAAVKSWFAKTGRTAYTCGPLLPSASKATADASEKTQSRESDEIETFLDNILSTSGKQTLLYVSNPSSRLLLAICQSSCLPCVVQISLGSVFWPKKAENIWAFLDIVMELGIPFVSASSITICHLVLTHCCSSDFRPRRVPHASARRGQREGHCVRKGNVVVMGAPTADSRARCPPSFSSHLLLSLISHR